MVFSWVLLSCLFNEIRISGGGWGPMVVTLRENCKNKKKSCRALETVVIRQTKDCECVRLCDGEAVHVNWAHVTTPFVSRFDHVWTRDD